MSEPHKQSERLALLARARRIWKLLPEGARLRFWKILGPGLQSAYGRQLLARPAQYRPADPQTPLVVAGLFSTANGIGEAARSTYRALQAAGLSPIAVDLSDKLASIDMVPDIKCQSMPMAQEGILILQLNGPETVAALQHLGMRRGRNWYTIGYWAWELPSFPKTWHRAFPFISELWTISQFSAAALSQHKRAPQTYVFPHAIVSPEYVETDRGQFGWQDDTFVFLTMADSMSSLQRKNPFAAIAAFKSAFGDDPSRHLVIKTRNLERDPQASADLRFAMEDATNIELLDVSLSEQKRWELLQAADAIISLHRAEGFGLVLAEAMALGKPVIVTNWSGNMDFTDATTSFLVESALVPCRDKYGVYDDETAQWADVFPDSARDQMLLVAQDAELRGRTANAAFNKMAKWGNPKRIGAAMAGRLTVIAAGDR